MGKILTVSVAAYNVENCISKCLDSFCVPEILEDIEVLIINDGSADRTGDIAGDYESKYPGTFRLIEKENGGHGSTINTGIQNASGKYFKVVDSDDWVERDGIIDLVGKLRTVDADAVISFYYKVDINGSKKTLVPAAGSTASLMNRVTSVFEIDPNCDACMPALTFKTELLRDHFIPIDEHCFYADLEYDVFYFSRAKKVFLSDVPVYDYLLGSSQQSVSIPSKLKHREEHLKIVRRLVDFFEKEQKKGMLPQATRKTIATAIVSMYGVLLRVPDKNESVKAVHAYDEELKQNSPQLYRYAIRFGMKNRMETAMGIAVLRFLRFHGYGVVHSLFSR